MSSLLRIGIVFVLLAPSLAHAAALGNPGSGLFYSGVGVISGWKCAANGPLTVRFFTADGDPHPDWMDSIPLVYGTERTDVRKNGQCLDNDHDNVGFVAIWNWANLGDGTHTAVVYDDDVWSLPAVRLRWRPSGRRLSGGRAVSAEFRIFPHRGRLRRWSGIRIPNISRWWE